MRVAIVHDWLTVYAGAERVLEELIKIFPHADLFSVIDFFTKEQRIHLLGKKAKTSFIQKLPFSKKLYRFYLPFMPLAIEQFDLSQYDLIISSSSSVAKGVLTGPNQKHISYCYSPMRYAWDLQNQYLKGKKALLKRGLLHKMRLWDVASSFRVDHFLTSSVFIKKRIQKIYRREATVIAPPVNCENFKLQMKKKEFYVTLSRLVPYKNIDLLIEAFKTTPERTLVIIGEGPERKKLMRKATKNVLFLGFLPQKELNDYLGKAKAFLFAAVEDFGIAPLEAQACGTPVIAYGEGGVRETIIDTGHFFYELTPKAVMKAICQFEQGERISPQKCRKNAERFSASLFREKILKSIEDV